LIEDKIREIIEEHAQNCIQGYELPVNDECIRRITELVNAEMKELKASVFWLSQAIHQIDDEVKEAKKWIK
jgi:hypothetical protein